jgi:hypothetical protein
MQLGSPFGLRFDFLMNDQHRKISSSVRWLKPEQGACQPGEL